MQASERRLATHFRASNGTIIRPFVSEQGPRMPFPRTRSLFLLSAASRMAASITANTIAPLMQRLGNTVARRARSAPERPAWRPGKRMSWEEMKAQDEQDMFDAQMPKLPMRSSTQQLPGGGARTQRRRT